MTLAQILDGVIIMAGLVLYWCYIPIFFSKIRPALAQKFGTKLGAQISESLSAEDAGTWETDSNASLWTQVKVLGLDMVILVTGLVIPFGLIALICAGIVESRVVANLANSFSGDTVKIEELKVLPVKAGTEPQYTIKVRNLSKSEQKDCYLSTSNNRHYLYANSGTFNLALDEVRELKFKGSWASNVGEYELVMKLFCPPSVERDRKTYSLEVLE